MARQPIALVSVSFALTIVTAAVASAPIKLLASDAASGDSFGYSVALDGDTAIVGAFRDTDSGGAEQGAAYIYVWDGSAWIEQAKLSASDAAADDWFGWRVAIDGDTAIIGAILDDDSAGVDQGAAYVFTRSGAGWTEQAKLTASDAAPDDWFGNAVAIESDTAIIGAQLDDDAAGLDQGAAYVFTRSGGVWTEQAKLTASDAAPEDRFGESAAIDGDTMIIGAALEDDGGMDAGSAYVFTWDGFAWSEQDKLTAGDGASGDQFGWSVALDGDVAVVGARLDDSPGADQGSAYVFTRSGGSWSEQTKLVASDGLSDDNFGWSVAIEADTAIVGAQLDEDAAGAGQGSVYVFKRSGAAWLEISKLIAPDAASGDRFGRAVALQGGRAIVGAYWNDDAGSASGAAYIFDTIESVSVGTNPKLTASDAAPGDHFGRSVAIDGDTAVVGATDQNGAGANAAYVYRWTGAGWTEEAVLIASDGALFDAFGSAVAIEGDTIVVGARFEDDLGLGNQGAAYVFTRTGSVWTEQAKLIASDASDLNLFGTSLAIDGDTLVVGAPSSASFGSGPGAAYVFRRSGGAWSEEAKLTASDAGEGDEFGFAVAVSGDTALIGAPLDDNGGASDRGGAYVFTRSGAVWTEHAKITASDGAAGDEFGAAAALDAGVALLGAPADDGASTTDSGSVYVYRFDGLGWPEEARLTALGGEANFDMFGASLALDGDTALAGAPFSGTGGAVDVFTFDESAWAPDTRLRAFDGSSTDSFGAAIALNGDFAIVGAMLDDGNAGSNQGSSYVFRRNGVGAWTADTGVSQELFAFDGGSADGLGSAVAVDGNWAVAGAPNFDGPGGTNQGAAYVYQRIAGFGWVEVATLYASDAAAGDQFGSSVDIDADTLVVGSPGKGSNSGAAYVFTLSAGLWSEQQKLIDDLGGISNEFGRSVSLDSDTVVIGSPGGGGFPVQSGKALVFTRSGAMWTEQTELFSGSPNSGDQFGDDVALFGDTIIVGAPGDGDFGSSSGIVTHFERVPPGSGDWFVVQSYYASAGAAGARFGNAIALDGDALLVGAPGEEGENGSLLAGAAYVFTRPVGGLSFSQQAKLTATIREQSANLGGFGGSVALDGSIAFVGAPGADSAVGEDTGAVFRFDRIDGLWTETGRYSPLTASPFDDFGAKVDVDGDQLVVGAPDDEGVASGNSAGSVTFTWLGALPLSVINTTDSAWFGSFDAALGEASLWDNLIATPAAFASASVIDTTSAPVAMESQFGIALPYTSTLTLGSGSILASAPGRDIRLYADGAVRSGALFFSENVVDVRGALSLTGGSINASGILVGGGLTGFGDLDGAVTNSGDVTIQADMQVVGDYTNNGVTTIQSGDLTILGTLTDNGTIVGDFSALRLSPGGFFVERDYAASAVATLSLRNGLARFGADADISINDNTRFDLSTSEVRMVGLAGETQSWERMSLDVGASDDGFDRTLPGHYPIETFRVGPAATTVNLVDTHDNDNLGQATCEALYVSHLIIDSGATLNTNGCPVYYETLTLNGAVDDLANLVQIVACVADLTGDGVVDGADLAALLAQWGTNGSADFTGDGDVDGADLAVLLAAWGACP